MWKLIFARIYIYRNLCELFNFKRFTRIYILGSGIFSFIASFSLYLYFLLENGTYPIPSGHKFSRAVIFAIWHFIRNFAELTLADEA